MRISTLMLATALACGALGAQTLGAQAATRHASHASASHEAASQVEPEAIEALSKMSAYLRTLPAFQITLQTQRDDVDVYGQLITLSGAATYRVRRPDAMAIDLAMPSVSRQYVYDGKTVTIFDPGTRYYARFDAPPTIGPALQQTFQRYGVELPLADLFTWTDGDPRAELLTSAHFIGKTEIGGQTVNHYAFREPGIDWQIWIADGDKPAPLRVAIVASDDPARPKFEADLAWDTSPQFSQDAFVFSPPENARLVHIRPLGP
jgi:hypothetical protein